MKTDMTDRFRLVVMGDPFVGKSAIVKRFLFGTFTGKYVATVEDLFSRDYELGGSALKVDILDTSGDAQFPAMRRLSIASAHAFLLVYSVTDPTSFAAVKHRFEEIREQRSDYQEIPIVVAGNKIDLVREVDERDVLGWIENDLPMLRTRAVDCSAKEDTNVVHIFKSFLVLARIKFGAPRSLRDDPAVTGLRRNLSARGRLKSPTKKAGLVTGNSSSNSLTIADPATANNLQMPPLSPTKKERKGSSGSSKSTTPVEKKRFFGIPLPGSGSTTPVHEANVANSNEDDGVFGTDPNEGYFIAKHTRNVKRSRSLIRRSSKKMQQQVNNVRNPDDCVIS